MKAKTFAAFGAVTLVAAFFFVNLRHPDTPVSPKATSGEPNPFPFVKSMQGTKPDGDLSVNADNSVVADAELRHFFDYYLGAIGEKNIDQIRAEIEFELDRKLQPTAARQAKELLSRYIAYKRALVDVEKNPQAAGFGISPVRARLMSIQQTRARFFSPKEIQGMFGFDDTYDADAVARLEIIQDKGLTAEQKKMKLTALDAAMPPALREAREAPLKVARMEEASEKMRANGASEDDIYRMRAAEFSPEAAARLAAVDQETSNWKSRIAAYQEERKSLTTNTALSDQDRQAALQQLRDMRFSISEQKRLAAYE
jgi:lipase chaperone LimK